jgi:hypothetical protein
MSLLIELILKALKRSLLLLKKNKQATFGDKIEQQQL